MAYLIDRQQALRDPDVVAVIGVRRRRVRSRIIMQDNSLYHTLTRARTLLRRANSGVPLPGGPV